MKNVQDAWESLIKDVLGTEEVNLINSKTTEKELELLRFCFFTGAISHLEMTKSLTATGLPNFMNAMLAIEKELYHFIETDKIAQIKEKGCENVVGIRTKK